MSINFAAMRAFTSYTARKKSKDPNLEEELLLAFDTLREAMKKVRERVRPKAFAAVMYGFSEQMLKEEKWPDET